MPSHRELLQTLLKGLETGDPASAAVVDETRYIQHNPQTHEGSEGLAVLFAKLAKTNPKVRFVRVFEDGEFAFAHNEYDFSTLRAAFEVFRFEQGKAVEHWDNIQGIQGPNPSGHSMLGGDTEIRDLDLTETNRALIKRFVLDALIGKDVYLFDDLVCADLIQHNPTMQDGRKALLDRLHPGGSAAPEITYFTLHRVLAEGNFVLSMSEGTRSGENTSFYDLWRIEDGKIAEHWDTIEKIAPRSEWKNTNGKF